MTASSTGGGVAPSASRPSKSPQIGVKKRWAFRGLAIVLGILPVAGLELVCVLFGWGDPTAYDDPFVGFSEIHPLFALDASGQNYEIPKSRRKFFAAESFPATKGSQTFRIFSFGGSTVQGHPFSTETSFPTYLELGLHEADTGAEWESINCGGVSYASYRLVPIVEECLRYEPDLFVICTGHNEFLEDRTYAHLKPSSASKGVSRLRLVTLFREGFRSLAEEAPAERPVLTADADVILDYQRGVESYHRDDAWQSAVVAHYEFNLRKMLALAERGGVPAILVLPPSNLGDCPPFKSEHRAGLTAAERTRFHELVGEAQRHYRTDLTRSVASLRAALKIDDRYALTWYELGQCLRTQGDWGGAREALVRARDEDICPLRMISSLEEALRRVADDTGTPLVDAQQLLEARCDDGILDEGQLVDYIHPSFSGYQHIADALIEEMGRLGLARPSDGWQPRAQAAYDRHLQALDSFYFLNGKETLRAAQRWAAGRGDGPSALERFPHRYSDEERQTRPATTPKAESSP